MWTFLSSGSRSQPRCAPFSRYSRILASSGGSGSEGEGNSITRYGHRGKKRCFCSTVSSASRSRRTQEASGERLAPLGSMNPLLESKETPVPSRLVQIPTCIVRSTLRLLALLQEKLTASVYL